MNIQELGSAIALGVLLFIFLVLFTITFITLKGILRRIRFKIEKKKILKVIPFFSIKVKILDKFYFKRMEIKKYLENKKLNKTKYKEETKDGDN